MKVGLLRNFKEDRKKKTCNKSIIKYKVESDKESKE